MSRYPRSDHFLQLVLTDVPCPPPSWYEQFLDVIDAKRGLCVPSTVAFPTCLKFPSTFLIYSIKCPKPCRRIQVFLIPEFLPAQLHQLSNYSTFPFKGLLFIWKFQPPQFLAGNAFDRTREPVKPLGLSCPLAFMQTRGISGTCKALSYLLNSHAAILCGWNSLGCALPYCCRPSVAAQHAASNVSRPRQPQSPSSFTRYSAPLFRSPLLPQPHQGCLAISSRSSGKSPTPSSTSPLIHGSS